MPHNISSTRQVPESHWLEVTARVGWPLLRFFSDLTHSTSCSIFGQVTWDTADFNWHFWISIFLFRGVCWIRGSRYWCQYLGSESCFKEPGVLIYRWNSNSFWRKSWWKARDGSWDFTASDAYLYFFLVQGCHATLLPRSVAWRLQKPAANDTTTLVKTLGTLTQQLVKLRHLPSPFPSRCSVDVMHSSFNSTQSALLGGEGDSRNSPL